MALRATKRLLEIFIKDLIECPEDQSLVEFFVHSG
jgi:hypothetical protein